LNHANVIDVNYFGIDNKIDDNGDEGERFVTKVDVKGVKRQRD
jgi:hypothetical protein